MSCSQLIVLFLLITIGCKLNVLPSERLIIAKYIVIDEEMSPGYVNCSDEVRPFLEMEANDCSFRLENHEFDILEKYILDSLGNLNQFWTFKSEGPLTYALRELQSDSLYYKTLNVDQINIKYLTPGNSIVDSGDTLEIEKVFMNEHLVFVHRKKDMIMKNRRIIYEYR